MTWPTAILWRCNKCRRGLMRTGALRFECLLCGSRQWVPIRSGRLTCADRLRLPRHTGMWPWIRHVQDPALD